MVKGEMQDILYKMTALSVLDALFPDGNPASLPQFDPITPNGSEIVYKTYKNHGVIGELFIYLTRLKNRGLCIII